MCQHPRPALSFAANASMVACLVGAVSKLPAQCQLEWQPGWPLAATDGRVEAIVETSQGVLVAGDFRHAMNFVANNVALWNGSDWQALGNGVPFPVLDSVVMSNGDVVVSGRPSGGAATDFVARWSGSAWLPLGAGLNDRVADLQLLPNGNLLASGIFTASGPQPLDGLAVYNGTSWTPYGGGINVVGFGVQQMELLANGDLAIAGSFMLPGQSATTNLAVYDGTAWTAIVLPGTNPFFTSLQELPNGDLAVGGSFGASNETMVIWDGTTASFEFSPVAGRIEALLLDAAGNLICGGTSSAGQSSVVARRVAGSWSSLRSGLDTTYAMHETTAGSLLVGSSIDNGTPSVMTYDGTAWQPLAGASDAIVNAVAAGEGATVFAGGAFDAIGTVPANNIARWDDATQSWLAMGQGLNGSVSDIVVSESGAAVVIGSFTTAGGGPADGIAVWDNGVWWSPGSAPSGPAGPVFAVATSPTDGIYAVTAFGVDLFANGNWVQLPTAGLPPVLVATAIELLPTGDLLVGIIGQQDTVLRWDGSTWSTMGTTTDATHAFAVDSTGQIYRAGEQRVERWTGTAWAALNPPQVNFPRDLLVLPNDDLVVAGGSTLGPFTLVQRFNGQSWTTVDQGVDVVYAPSNPEWSLAWTDVGELWFASHFSSIGSVISPYLARARSTCPALAVSVGQGCSGMGGPDRLTAVTPPWIDATFRSEVRGLPFLTPSLAVHALGMPQTTTPLPLGATGCSLYVRPILLELLPVTSLTVAADFVLPNNPALVGRSFRTQVVGIELSPSGDITQLTSSNALDLTVGAY